MRLHRDFGAADLIDYHYMPSATGAKDERPRADLLIGEHYQLRDLGSTNGTRVNSELMTDTFLRVGDRIRFGKVEARYESDATGEAQQIPDTDGTDGRPAETSEKPADFANASPFPNREKEKDTVATAILAAAALAILAFLVSMFGLLQIHGPG
jgi:hypothetical protein